MITFCLALSSLNLSTAHNTHRHVSFFIIVLDLYNMIEKNKTKPKKQRLWKSNIRNQTLAALIDQSAICYLNSAF